MSDSMRAAADEFRDQSLATLEAHPEWTQAWIDRTYLAEDDNDRMTLEEIPSDDLVMAAFELLEELAPPTRED